MDTQLCKCHPFFIFDLFLFFFMVFYLYPVKKLGATSMVGALEGSKQEEQIHNPFSWTWLQQTVLIRDGLGCVRDPTCPIAPECQNCTRLVTGSETFRSMCSYGSGNVTLPVIRGVQCQLPGGIGQVGPRTCRSRSLVLMADWVCRKAQVLYVVAK